MAETARPGPWDSDDYHVSPHNWAPEIRAQYRFREPLVLQDFTLAKMDMLEGSRLYSAEEYVEVARLLDETGIRETCFLTAIRPGTPKDDRALAGLEAVAKAGLNIRLVVYGWFAAWPEGQYRSQIDRIAAYGAHVVGLSTLPQHVLEEFVPGAKVDERRAELPKAIDHALRQGLDVCISITHAGREPIEKLAAEVRFCADNGATSVLLSDAKGVMTVDATRYFLTMVRAEVARDISIYYHAHNDFGSATSLALAAATAGAWPQVTVNGVADRGFASLEEVAVSLELLYGVRTGVRLEKLQQLAHTVERITGTRNSPFKPITGDAINIPPLEPGYVGLVRGKRSLEVTVMNPFDLALIGLRPQVVMTYGLLNDATIQARLEALGLPADPTRIRKAFDAIRRRLDSLGNKYPVVLRDAEVVEICRQVASE